MPHGSERTGPAVEPSSSAASHPRQPLPHLLDDLDDLAWSASSVDPSQPHARPPPPSVSSQHGNFASQRPHNRSEQPPPAFARPHAPTSLAASSAPPPATTGSQTAASARDTIGAAPPNPSHPQCPRGAPLVARPSAARLHSSVLPLQESSPHALQASQRVTFGPALVPLTQHFHISTLNAAAFTKQRKPTLFDRRRQLPSGRFCALCHCLLANVPSIIEAAQPEFVRGCAPAAHCPVACVIRSAPLRSVAEDLLAQRGDSLGFTVGYRWRSSYIVASLSMAPNPHLNLLSTFHYTQ